MKKGFYIVFEGPEGGGKGTQLELTCEYLNNKRLSCVKTLEPGGTEVGKEIREILQYKNNLDLHPLAEFFLFSADRVQKFYGNVIPALKEGKIVLSDRDFNSSLAYQGYGGKVDKNFIKEVSEIATFNVKPNLTFILYQEDMKKALEEIKNPDRFEKKSLEYHQKVLEGYKQIANEYPKEYVLMPRKRKSIDEVQQEIRQCLKEKLGI